MDEILERSLKFSERYGHMTLEEVMIELEKYEQLKSDLRKLVDEYNWLYHEGESLRTLYLRLKRLGGVSDEYNTL
jgi:hypothetical protein